ncbi:hypothetical protein AVEN_266481-1 [Araneus ventricosus]|uniref:Uncharacterized protein n=1 Tax=Araneus ventricosus TaxID=182803 RepID=A0A4Y2DZ03_ARAVE|nr:hypothetical protein AVEN_266481-1 [Araneus ventricosus]
MSNLCGLCITKQRKRKYSRKFQKRYDNCFCHKRSHGGLVVRPRFQNWEVLSSKPNSTKDPLCICALLPVKSGAQDQASSRCCGVNPRRGGCRLRRHLRRLVTV